MTERPEYDPKPPTSYLSDEEEKWIATATKFKFLGISPIRLFEFLCNLYPSDFRAEYQDEMIESYKLGLGERLEKRSRSVPFYICLEYKGIVTSSFAMRFQKNRDSLV